MFKCCQYTSRSTDPSTPSASAVGRPTQGLSYDKKLGRILLITAFVCLLFATLCATGVFGRGTPYLVAFGLTLVTIPQFCVAAVKLCLPPSFKPQTKGILDRDNEV